MQLPLVLTTAYAPSMPARGQVGIGLPVPGENETLPRSTAIEGLLTGSLSRCARRNKRLTAHLPQTREPADCS